MPLYIGDYLADTTHLTQAEHGAYLLLLMAMWRAGGKLPANDPQLARFCRCTGPQWNRIRETILAFFEWDDGCLTQRRLSAELTKYEATLSQKSRAGLASARKKAVEKAQLSPTAVPTKSNEPEPEPITDEDKPSSVSARSPKRASKRGTRLDPSWSPSEIDVAYARKKGLTEQEIERGVEEFRNYWVAKPGAGALKLDWGATWRNRVLDIIDRRGRGSGVATASRHAQGGGRGPSSFADIIARRRGYSPDREPFP